MVFDVTLHQKLQKLEIRVEIKGFLEIMVHRHIDPLTKTSQRKKIKKDSIYHSPCQIHTPRMSSSNSDIDTYIYTGHVGALGSEYPYSPFIPLPKGVQIQFDLFRSLENDAEKYGT